MNRPKHILLLSGASKNLVTFRQPLIKAMIAAGHQVTAIGNENDDEVAQTLGDWGARFEFVPLARTGMNPVNDIYTFAALLRLMRRIRPDIFFGTTIKPSAYGLLAARLSGVGKRIAMIEGLGYAFGDGQEFKRKLARIAIEFLFWCTLPRANIIIVLNRDDELYFRNLRYLSARQQIARIPSIGVNLDYYSDTALPAGPVTFVLISRLLRDKGVGEYVAAARRVKKEVPASRFLLVGPTDPNPSGFGKQDVEAWKAEGVIEYLGEVADVRPALAQSHVFVLPSYYREGIPRTILEAMSMGRPVIVTDTPGCRETAIDGKNGVIIPPRNVTALAEAMLRCIHATPSELSAMGTESRRLASENFDEKTITAATMDLIGLRNSASR